MTLYEYYYKQNVIHNCSLKSELLLPRWPNTGASGIKWNWVRMHARDMDGGQVPTRTIASIDPGSLVSTIPHVRVGLQLKAVSYTGEDGAAVNLSTPRLKTRMPLGLSQSIRFLDA